MTRIAELQDRLRRLAKRREGEGIYTDAAICEEAAEALSRTGGMKVKPLDEDDYEEIISAAAINMRKATSGIRGQVITVQDSLDWWVMKETERRILSALAHPPAQAGAVTEAQGWRPIETAPMDGTVVFKLPTMTPKGDLGFIAATIDDRLDEDDVDYPTTEARARWIARCSPDAIAGLLTLIERLAASQAETRRLALEEAARVVKPSGNRPCDCDRCDCGNVGDAEAVAAWDALDAPYRAIRALIDQPSTEGGKDG